MTFALNRMVEISNKYAPLAQDQWKTAALHRHADLPNPEQYFQEMGGVGDPPGRWTRHRPDGRPAWRIARTG